MGSQGEVVITRNNPRTTNSWGPVSLRPPYGNRRSCVWRRTYPDDASKPAPFSRGAKLLGAGLCNIYISNRPRTLLLGYLVPPLVCEVYIAKHSLAVGLQGAGQDLLKRCLHRRLERHEPNLNRTVYEQICREGNGFPVG